MCLAGAVLIAGCGLGAATIASLATGAVGTLYSAYEGYEAITASPTPIATPLETPTPTAVAASPVVK